MNESRVSKRSREDNRTAESNRDRRDRLSELPDSLILVILSLLEMKDVVRTTILSKRWKDVWTTVPCLDFCDENNPSFIEGALAKWKGAKILKFSIRFWGEYPPSHILDSWLFVPIEKQVENLFIHSDYDMYHPQYCVPQRLYSCTSITKLCLYHYNLKIEENVNVQWNQLKSLEIEQCIDYYYTREEVLNRIISGAPLLEELVLSYWNINENLNIRSASLKMLKIDMDVYQFDEFKGDAQVLKVWAPNLKSFKISQLWRTRCLLNAPALINATLGFNLRYYFSMLDKPPNYTELHEIMRQAFLSLSHVVKLTLNEWAIKFFVVEMKKENFVLFSKLEMLIFEPEECCYDKVGDCFSLAPSPNTIFPSLSLSLLQLKTIVITWDVPDVSIFEAIEILLENARALEKMVIRIREHKAYPKEYILALETMMSMRRASPYVKVIIRKV